MPAAEKVDVVVAVDRISTRTLRSLHQVIGINDPALGRLIVVTGIPVEASLESFAKAFPVVSVVQRMGDPCGVAAWNRGLHERGGDVVLLAADTMVAPGWLTELSAVAHSEERTAFAWPLSNTISVSSARQAFSGLPASTTAETTQGECVYLRDRSSMRSDSWMRVSQPFSSPSKTGSCERRRLVSSVSVPIMRTWSPSVQEPARTNRSKRFCVIERSWTGDIRIERHQVEMFRRSLDGSIARHAADFKRTGKLRILYDIRHLTPLPDRAGASAINLARLLAINPAIELTLLVNELAQARGLGGRAITPEGCAR